MKIGEWIRSVSSKRFAMYLGGLLLVSSFVDYFITHVSIPEMHLITLTGLILGLGAANAYIEVQKHKIR